MQYEGAVLKAGEDMICQSLKFGKAIRPVFADPVTFIGKNITSYLQTRNISNIEGDKAHHTRKISEMNNERCYFKALFEL